MSDVRKRAAKRAVLSRRRKMAAEVAAVTSSGRLFQTLEAATENVLSPIVDSRHRGMASDEDDDDRRRDRQGKVETLQRSRDR